MIDVRIPNRDRLTRLRQNGLGVSGWRYEIGKYRNEYQYDNDAQPHHGQLVLTESPEERGFVAASRGSKLCL